MKTKLATLLLFFCANLLFSQTIYEELPSSKLDTVRQIKIQLPRNYETNTEKLYPLFIVLDGDYLFEPVAGNVDYYSYWEDMPEAIVVGINQVNTRDEDCHYSDQNFFPAKTGAKFFEFVGMELIPHLEDKYRLADFKVIVGHGETANFLHYYLFKDSPLFNAYIALSPDFALGVLENLPTRLGELKPKTFYYLATSDNDIKPLKKDAIKLNESLAAIEKEAFIYSFNKFEKPTHYSLPAHAIPNALESIFYVFQPISKAEYKEKILTLETSPVEYLKEKYALINDMFNLKKQILVNDFKAIAAAIEKKEQFDHYEALGKLARKEHPDTLLGHYFLGRYYEETGSPKKAMRTYRSAYVLEEVGGYTKDEMLERADAIKRDFGY